MDKHKFKFIDLFAGLGGFHKALNQMGGECVFASELKGDLRELYMINYPEMQGKCESGMNKVMGDITAVIPEMIPDHNVLCAGFPCQPFSQAGKRQGFNDELGRGNLFNYICRILSVKQPEYIFLENVSNLLGHDGGHTWETIEKKLTGILPVDESDMKYWNKYLDYEIDKRILSPHEFGIPQHRKRIYIVGRLKSKGGLDNFNWPEPTNQECDIKSIIKENDCDIIPLKLETHQQLKVWQNFLDQCKKYKVEVPRFPIWAMEFGADYPYEECAPAYNQLKNIKGKKGKFGEQITGANLQACLRFLPIYAQTDKTKVFPGWKIKYISQNRAFYQANKAWLDPWIETIKGFENSHIKFEWNVGPEAPLNISENIVQFRASGIRVKAPTYSPALNLVGTQIPIIPWVKLPAECVKKYSKQELAECGLAAKDIKKGRYLSVYETATLQGMQNLKFKSEESDFKLSNTRIYEALGNAVNTQVVETIARCLIKHT